VNAAYLALAAAAILIFTACILAARKMPRRLKPMRVLIIALISLIAVLVLWLFIAIMSRPHTEEQEAPSDQPANSGSNLRIIGNAT
jgi:drug/metabolite transporter (DMT)-like permease